MPAHSASKTRVNALMSRASTSFSNKARRGWPGQSPAMTWRGSHLVLIPLVVRLERPLARHADIFRLLVGELGQFGADLVEMQPRDLLVEMLGQGIDLLLVLARIGPQLDLRQRLVGEGGRHHEARMPHGIAQI